MKNVKILTTLEEIKSFSDPYRIIILKHYFRLKRPCTVKQIADEMGEVPAKVHYHVKKLEASGILCLNHTKEINGILAKYYLPAAKTFKIENQAIGKFQFNNQVIDFEQQYQMESLQKGHLFEQYLGLTSSELEHLMVFLESVRQNDLSENHEERPKKFYVCVTSFE